MEADARVDNYVPGAIGPYRDDCSLITLANIRPYVVAILLHRGGVKVQEVVGALVPHCLTSELKSGELTDHQDFDCADETKLERSIKQVLMQMKDSGLLIWQEKNDLWVLTAGEQCRNIPRIINWVTSTNAQLPQRIFSDIMGSRLDPNFG